MIKITNKPLKKTQSKNPYRTAYVRRQTENVFSIQNRIQWKLLCDMYHTCLLNKEHETVFLAFKYHQNHTLYFCVRAKNTNTEQGCNLSWLLLFKIKNNQPTNQMISGWQLTSKIIVWILCHLVLLWYSAYRRDSMGQLCNTTQNTDWIISLRIPMMILIVG